MNEIIKLNYVEIPGAIDHIKFIAQQYFNNHGMGWKCVTSAKIIEGGISCEWECAHPDRQKPVDNFTREESAAFNSAVAETIGPDKESSGTTGNDPIVTDLESEDVSIPKGKKRRGRKPKNK